MEYRSFHLQASVPSYAIDWKSLSLDGCAEEWVGGLCSVSREQIGALLNHTGIFNRELGAGTFCWLGPLLPGGKSPQFISLQLLSGDVSPGRDVSPGKDMSPGKDLSRCRDLCLCNSPFPSCCCCSGDERGWREKMEGNIHPHPIPAPAWACPSRWMPGTALEPRYHLVMSKGSLFNPKGSLIRLFQEKIYRG